jgi:hypothetical protein
VSLLNFNMVTAPPVVIEDFQDAGEWTTTDATVADDTSHIHTGTQSILLTATTPGTSAFMKKSGLELDLSDGFPMRLWFKFPAAADYKQIPAIDIYFKTSEGNHYWDSLFIYSTVDDEKLANGIWMSWTLEPSAFDAVGDPDWSNITIIQVKIRAADGTTPSINCGRFERIHVQGGIMFDFDDGLESIYDHAKDVLHERGIRASCYIIPDRVGDPTYMTLAELTELHELGWDMCNHGFNHVDQRPLTYAQAYADINNARVWMDERGFGRASRHFGYYGGVVGVNTLPAMSAAGMLTGRISGSFLTTLPFGNPYLLWGHSLVAGEPDPVGYALAWIAKAQAYGGLVRFITHTVGPGLNIEASELATIADAAADAGLPIMTQSNLYEASLGEAYVTGGDTLGYGVDRATVPVSGAQVDGAYFSGDSRPLEVTITQENGQPQNLTGWTFRYAVAPALGAVAEMVKTSADGIEVAANPQTGVVTVHRAPADTASLSGYKYHELQATDPAGNVSTVLHGRLRIRPDSA